MSRVCQVTGKKPMKGHLVSHANNKTIRTFQPNLMTSMLESAERNKTAEEELMRLSAEQSWSAT